VLTGFAKGTDLIKAKKEIATADRQEFINQF
jgi:hypothetical protein